MPLFHHVGTRCAEGARNDSREEAGVSARASLIALTVGWIVDFLVGGEAFN